MREKYRNWWTELPFMQGRVSLQNINDAVRETAHALDLSTMQEQKTYKYAAPLRKANYVAEDWMLNLIKEFPSEKPQAPQEFYSNPFPILWTQAWRSLANRNQLNSSK